MHDIIWCNQDLFNLTAYHLMICHDIDLHLHGLKYYHDLPFFQDLTLLNKYLPDISIDWRFDRVDIRVYEKRLALSSSKQVILADRQEMRGAYHLEEPE